MMIIVVIALVLALKRGGVGSGRWRSASSSRCCR